MNQLRTLVYLLVFILATALVQAHQLPIVPEPDLPKDYETWQESNITTLTIRPGLVAEFQSWKDKSNDRGRFVQISKLNSDIIHFIFIEVLNDNSDPDPIMYITSGWLTETGYINLSDKKEIQGKLKYSSELIKNIEQAWKISDGFLRHRYNLNEDELGKLEKFFGW